MSLTADLTADIRARANYIAPCPVCSFLEIDGAPNIITYPSLHRRRRAGNFGLIHCCQLSADCPNFETEADAAAWWNVARSTPHPWPSIAARQANTLLKLERAGLEPITAQSEATP